MKARSPSIHITLDSIDDLSLACISPPVRRKYASSFKSKLAKFVASIHQPTLMNIMEYLIKFKEWYLSVREGHASPVLLYEDLLIIGIFKVNQNQLMHTEMTLILAKLQELLGRSKRAVQVRCFNYLLHLTEEEINKAVLTDTDFVMSKDSGYNYSQIEVFAVNRKDWTSNLQRMEKRQRMKGQQSIGTMVGQRMAAIRMYYLNTLVYTQQSLNSLTKIMQENSSNLQGSLTNQSENSIASQTAYRNQRPRYKKTVKYTDQTRPTIKSKRHNPQTNSPNSVDELIEQFSQGTSTKKINFIIGSAKNKSAVKIVEDILKFYCEQRDDNLSVRQVEKDNMLYSSNEFQQKQINNIFVHPDDSGQQDNYGRNDSNGLMRTFEQHPNSLLQYSEKIGEQSINIVSNNDTPVSENFNHQQHSFQTLSSFDIPSSLFRNLSERDYETIHAFKSEKDGQSLTKKKYFRECSKIIGFKSY